MHRFVSCRWRLCLSCAALALHARNSACSIGVLPKDTADGKDIVWFENPDPKYCFHIANAWDDGTTVKMAMVSPVDYQPASALASFPHLCVCVCACF